MDPKTSFKIPLLLRKRRQKYTDSISIPSQPASQPLNRTLPLLSFEKALQKSTTLKNITPQFGMKLSFGYRNDNFLTESEMKSRFPNHSLSHSQFLQLDKTFFKRKDELSQYNEIVLRQQLLSTSKTVPKAKKSPKKD
jgi:hypothetical protein